MLCGNCGHDNPTDHRFCGMCGMRLERIPVPQREPSRSDYRELVRRRIGTPPETGDATLVQSERTPEPPKEVISFDRPNERAHASRDDSQSAPGNGNSVEPPAQRPRQRAVSGPSFLNLEVPAEPPRNEAGPGQTISGPSFLGLADDGGTREGRYNIDYLLDEEPKESHWRLWLVLIILSLFGVLAWLQLRHAGVDVTGLMQRLRQAKLGTVQEQTHPTTGSSDVAPVEADKSSQASQTVTGQKTATPPANGATPASVGNQSATASGQPGSADATKADATKNETAKSADQSRSPQQSDSVGKGNSAAGAAPEMKQPGSDNGKSSDQAASDNSTGAEETSGSTSTAKSDQAATIAKNTKPKKPSASVEDSRGRAAREQNAQGAVLVATGEKYLYGRGVPQNCERAISYLRKAADMGNAKGTSHLGAMYATGQCLPMDRVRAYKYFALALHQDSSNQYFQHNLEMLWNEMSPDEKQQATARTPAQ